MTNMDTERLSAGRSASIGRFRNGRVEFYARFYSNPAYVAMVISVDDKTLMSLGGNADEITALNGQPARIQIRNANIDLGEENAARFLACVAAWTAAQEVKS